MPKDCVTNFALDYRQGRSSIPSDHIVRRLQSHASHRSLQVHNARLLRVQGQRSYSRIDDVQRSRPVVDPTAFADNRQLPTLQRIDEAFARGGRWHDYGKFHPIYVTTINRYIYFLCLIDSIRLNQCTKKYFNDAVHEIHEVHKDASSAVQKFLDEATF